MVIHLSKSVQLERSQVETLYVCGENVLSVSAQITTDIFSSFWAICMCVSHKCAYLDQIQKIETAQTDSFDFVSFFIRQLPVDSKVVSFCFKYEIL